MWHSSVETFIIFLLALWAGTCNNNNNINNNNNNHINNNNNIIKKKRKKKNTTTTIRTLSTVSHLILTGFRINNQNNLVGFDTIGTNLELLFYCQLKCLILVRCSLSSFAQGYLIVTALAGNDQTLLLNAFHRFYNQLLNFY